MVGLPDSEKNFEDMYSRLDTIPKCDRRTDGQTDGRTDILPRYSPRYAYASRSKNSRPRHDPGAVIDLLLKSYNGSCFLVILLLTQKLTQPNTYRRAVVITGSCGITVDNY